MIKNQIRKILCVCYCVLFTFNTYAIDTLLCDSHNNVIVEDTITVSLNYQDVTEKEWRPQDWAALISAISGVLIAIASFICAIIQNNVNHKHNMQEKKIGLQHEKNLEMKKICLEKQGIVVAKMSELLLKLSEKKNILEEEIMQFQNLAISSFVYMSEEMYNNASEFLDILINNTLPLDDAKIDKLTKFVANFIQEESKTRDEIMKIDNA